ncbi:hypothetical protein PTSG_12610 [Salpingoeca rosetta]|uniref:Uncharacterized protein n=1 Tax=Salpingoeca rosetta (strain ATCC 50818 / BSB-021) TaxID=946362 RepID=F2UH65_SALR5|nr:uncharacterized protein PTSG_12610 [Salpingoeca rosetta]EGD76464.1 hypothetical protein PTSG_12610 [Salpingoeca rosetta]|eukprot:XP_004991379.1 hypothetical protein PTSG_12610 [Salpingoeca rosetta]
MLVCSVLVLPHTPHVTEQYLCAFLLLLLVAVFLDFTLSPQPAPTNKQDTKPAKHRNQHTCLSVCIFDRVSTSSLLFACLRLDLPTRLSSHSGSRPGSLLPIYVCL